MILRLSGPEALKAIKIHLEMWDLYVCMFRQQLAQLIFVSPQNAVRLKSDGGAVFMLPTYIITQGREIIKGQQGTREKNEAIYRQFFILMKPTRCFVRREAVWSLNSW